LAKRLLSWDAGAGQTNAPAQVRLTLTHAEIAEMIGTTRETVSRLFSEFKKNQLLQVKGSTLSIRNKALKVRNAQVSLARTVERIS
jgi:CRP/FNR family transcriptional regulator, cyclic AMP receptor protein